MPAAAYKLPEGQRKTRMKKIWIATNLLLLAITVLFGRHVRNSIDDYKNKINPDGVKLIQTDKPELAPDKVLPAPNPPKICNPADFSVIAEKVLFFENRINEEKQPDTAQTLASEVPPLTQKPILVGTSISDNRQLAFIIDPAVLQRVQGGAQPTRQGDQAPAPAVNQGGSVQGIAQALSQGSGMQGIAQALNQGGGMQGLAQALGQGGGGMQQIMQAMGGMPGLIQALGQGSGTQGLAQTLGPGGGMPQIVQALGGMQGIAQALSQGASGIQGLLQSVRQLGNQPVAQNPRSQVQIKRVGDLYHGYTITHINAEDIVLESGSRMEVIPLHEGSKLPKVGKTAIQPTRVVSFGTMGTTGGTSPARGAGSQPMAGVQPNAQPTQGRGGMATAGNTSMPQPAATPQSLRPTMPSGITIDQNTIRMLLGGVMAN
jgi:hypothetical protein